MSEITWRPMAIGNYMYSKKENKFVKIDFSNRSNYKGNTDEELLKIINLQSIRADDFRDKLFWDNRNP